MAMRYRNLKQCQFNKDAIAVYRCVFYRAISCEKSLHLWQTKRDARERASAPLIRVSFCVLLSRDFSWLPQMESLLFHRTGRLIPQLPRMPLVK